MSRQHIHDRAGNWMVNASERLRVISHARNHPKIKGQELESLEFFLFKMILSLDGGPCYSLAVPYELSHWKKRAVG